MYGLKCFQNAARIVCFVAVNEKLKFGCITSKNTDLLRGFSVNKQPYLFNANSEVLAALPNEYV